jgi:phage terminase large subunit-like protein
MRGSPNAWARRAVGAFRKYRADEIVAEGNQGGDLVRVTLQTVDEDVPVNIVHASHGKRTRAEPVAALYEQGRVHHVGTFPTLEDQLCLWDATSGDISPDRLDALVWAVTQLGVDNAPVRLITAHSPADARVPPSGWLRDILMRGPSPRPTESTTQNDDGPADR